MKDENNTSEEPKKNAFGFPVSDEYIGNMWGWKVSYIGLGLILFLGALMLYRHWQLNDWRPMTDPNQTEIKVSQ